MQDENWFTSRIWSSFDCYKAVFMHIFCAVHNLSIMKENEHRSTKHSFKNTFSRWSFSQRQDSDRRQSNWDHLCTTKSY